VNGLAIGDANDVIFSCGRDLICVEPLQESVARGTRATPPGDDKRSSVRVRREDADPAGFSS